MKDTRSILVVNSDPIGLHGTIGVLESAGYEVDAVRSFADARCRLESTRPDLLMTAVRLGPYNGLHLIVRSRNHLPAMATILTHDDADPVLLTEAAANDAAFLILPCNPAMILETVEASLERRKNPTNMEIPGKKSAPAAPSKSDN
jgi:DNA-binding NtrC family response regulator